MSHQFTRMDVVVTVLALGILGAIGFSTLNAQGGIADRGNVTNCMNNLKQLQMAVLTYKVQFKRYPNVTGENDIAFGSTYASKTNGLKFIETLYMGKKPLLSKSDLLECPSNEKNTPKKYKKKEKSPYNFNVGDSGYIFRNTKEHKLTSKGASTSPVIADRATNHGNQYNVVFVDGHVETLAIGQKFHYEDSDDADSALYDKPYKKDDKTIKKLLVK